MNIMLFRFELGPSTNLTADLWIFFALSMMLKMAPKMIWAKEPLYPSQAIHDILNYLILLHFLDASSHLYNRACPSVGPSVRRSVRNAFVSAGRDETANDLFRVYELVCLIYGLGQSTNNLDYF